MSTEPLLQVEGLSVAYDTDRGRVDAVRGASFTVAAGSTVAIVGESGSGKSTTVHALVRLLSSGGSITSGSVRFQGEDLARASAAELRRVRGRLVGLVPQDPTVSLNPVTRVGAQVAEVLRLHGLAGRRTAHAAAVEALGHAGLSDPETRAQQYPHELSGGMRQRVLIAMAIVARPPLIIADEPTSALDVTVQRQILDHLDTVKRDLGTSLLLVTHDLGVAADRADRILVMSQGEIVEEVTPTEVLGAPMHPYTRRLIAAAPSLNAHHEPVAGEAHPAVTAARPDGLFAGAPADPSGAGEMLRVEHLVKEFALPRSAGRAPVRAVDDVSFAIERGRTFALVGESGSGKTTTARLALRLADPTGGRILLDGDDATELRGARLRALRRRAQLVQQNPYAALNPRLTIEQIVTDPLRAFRVDSRAEQARRAAELVDVVALPASALRRRAAELSGGQRQRVAIARALALSPQLLVLDEPVSALDVSIQHQILTLLADLQAEYGLSYLFISHDLAVVRRIAHTVGVMRRGRLVESGPVADVFDAPSDAYTRALLDAIPGTRARLT